MIHELTAMNIQMRLITSDNIENLTSYGKHNLGKLNKFIERSENFVETPVSKPLQIPNAKTVTINPTVTELDVNEQKALFYDIERLKKNNIYSAEEEEKSKKSILDLRTQLKEGNITQLEYNKLLIPDIKESNTNMTETSENEESNTNMSETSENEDSNTNMSETSENEESNENMTETSENEESGDELKEYTPPVQTSKIIKLN